jgi:hypothetical protein
MPSNGIRITRRIEKLNWKLRWHFSDGNSTRHKNGGEKRLEMKMTAICGMILLILTGVCFGQTVTAPQAAALGASVVECPARLEPGAGVLSGVPMEYKEGYSVPVPTQAFLNTIPQSWEHDRTQTYSGQSYVIINNDIVNNNFVCYYGIKQGNQQYYFVSIKKAIPATKLCKVASDNKFQCTMKPIIKK